MSEVKVKKNKGGQASPIQVVLHSEEVKEVCFSTCKGMETQPNGSEDPEQK